MLNCDLLQASSQSVDKFPDFFRNTASDIFLLVLKMKQVVKPLRNLPMKSSNKPKHDSRDSQLSPEPEKENRYVVDEGNF